MTELLEFFVPTKAQDLESAEKQGADHFVVQAACDFDVPAEQQLDDLTRLFDALHREKSPTALFTKPELFYPLFSYIKALQDKDLNAEVIRASRHKICHEISERMKKLLQVTIAFIKKQKTAERTDSKALVICLRSTLKMYAFILCGVLSSSAPTEDDEGAAMSQQHRTNKKRKRREAVGFGDDNSGVDMDGRELALNALVELCSKEVMCIWPNDVLEHGLLNVMFSMSLHMITQKANIGDDAQSISSSLALLLARVTSCMLFKNASIDPADLVSPMVELAMKSDCAAIFLSKFVSDIEQEESVSDQSQALLESLFKGMSHAALDDAPNDSVAAKNISLFFSEVAKKSVSATVKMCDLILPVLQSENYDIRKAVITCIAEMVIQRYTGHSRSSTDDVARNRYLNELLFRVMDINPFVRNHVLHIWERLVDVKAVPKRYHLAITEALVGRLEDRNYLVRDAAMATISSILRRNWFGQVLNSHLVGEKLLECTEEARPILSGVCSLEDALSTVRSQFQPVEEDGEDPLSGEDEPAEPRAELNLTEEQMTVVNRVLFYENTLLFIEHIKKALQYAVQLLDSRTDRDVIESIKLIVACSEYRLEAGDKAFLKVLVMAFEGEMKIQLAVRDAFVEVIFVSLGRLSGSPMTRATASAQKLIAVLKMASEGEVSAVERIFFLLKSNPAFSRHISGHFIDAVWGIAEGSVDQEASIEDRRTAMRVYSLLSKFFWKDLRTRKESILDFLVSDSIKDNTVISYVFTALEQQSLDPQFVPIAASVDPTTHPELKHFVTHLCRKTTAVASWMRLAQAAINAIHHLCELPVVLFTYVLRYLGDRVQLNDDPNAKTQLFFLVGITALKQLVSVETTERVQIKSLEDAPNKQPNSNNIVGADSMHKELGFGSQECRRHAIQELAQKRKQAIVAEGSIWFQFASDVVAACRQKPTTLTAENPYERIAAVMALCYLMIVNEEFCAQNLNLLFSLVANKKELWVIKTNIVIALGDLACVHPNLLGPYLNVSTTGFFKLLVDDDVRVRAVTIQVCSHLVLGEMLRIRDHLYTIVKLVADPDETIASNAVTFVQNLAMKEKEKTGNLIPPLVTELSAVMPADKFQLAMRSLLERVEGDKPTVSLIDRLCRRFMPYFEKDKKRLQLALNIAFCLGELSYNTEGPTKQIMSEACYQQYKDWLRNPEVLECFKAIVAKAKRAGRAGAERRDKTALEEWEARMIADSCSQNEGGKPEEQEATS